MLERIAEVALVAPSYGFTQMINHQLTSSEFFISVPLFTIHYSLTTFFQVLALLIVK